MAKYFDLATGVLEDTTFPTLPEPGDERRETLPNHSPNGGSKFESNFDRRKVRLGDYILKTIHLNWVICSSSEAARNGLSYLIAMENMEGFWPKAVTGRVTTPGVLSLVQGVFGDEDEWETFVEFSGRAEELGCVAAGPCSSEFHQQLLESAGEGAPFVAFSLDPQLED